jgi:hypothetical protein
MRAFKINNGLTLSDYEKNIKTFINNPTNLGAGPGQCMKFLRLLIGKFGFQLTPLGMDAWEFFAGVLGTSNIGLKLVEKKWDKSLTNADLKKIGVVEGSIIFGYYTSSSHFVDGLNANKKANADAARATLKKNRFDSIPKRSVDENVCTHVGYFLNGSMYHKINNKKNIHQNPTGSFRMIGWLPFDKIVRSKLS